MVKFYGLDTIQEISKLLVVDQNQIISKWRERQEKGCLYSRIITDIVYYPFAITLLTVYAAH